LLDLMPFRRAMPAEEYWAVWKQLNINPPLDGPYFILRPIVAPSFLPNAPLSRFYIHNRASSDFERKGLTGMYLGLGLKYGMFLGGQGDAKGSVNLGKGLDISQQFEGRIAGSMPSNWLGRLTNISYFIGKQNEIFSTKFVIEKTLRPEYYSVGDNHKLRGWIESHDVLRAPTWDESTLLDGTGPTFSLENVPLPWNSKMNRVTGVGYNYTSRNGATTADLFGEASLWSSSYSFVRARLTASHTDDLFWGMRHTIRFNGGIGKGDLPTERQFNLQVADPTMHHLSDTYNAYRWLGVTGLEVGLRGGAGLLGKPVKNPKGPEPLWGNNMIGLNWDITLFKMPYLPQLTIEANIGAGWVGDTFHGLKDLWDLTRISAGPTANLDIKALLPSQLQGVLDQYAITPILKVDVDGKIFLGTSF
jgi:hypothetical protein